ncbi:MAG: hypothetical protein R3F59_29330 [Myxococcota bacterium]
MVELDADGAWTADGPAPVPDDAEDAAIHAAVLTQALASIDGPGAPRQQARAWP